MASPYMKKKDNPSRISILGAGWLGFTLGKHLAQLGFVVKGSTTRKEKSAEIEQAGMHPFLVRVGLQVEGSRLEHFFDADILILNIPPGRNRPDVEDRHPREIRAVYERAIAGGISKLLFISSTGVYRNTNRIITEADLPDPTRPPGHALARIEQFLRRQTLLECTILRMAGLVGGDRHPGRFLSGRKNVPNPDAPVNIVHRDDAIGVISEVIRQHQWGEVYNVCADLHPTRRDFYTQQAHKDGLEAPTWQDSKMATYKIISNEKVRMELNYTFRHPDPMTF